MTAPPSGPSTKPKPTTSSQQRTSSAKAKFSLSTPSSRPPRIVLNGVEGCGKTSCGAYAELPALVMAAGETGYTTLVNAGRAPTVPHATVGEWGELFELLADFDPSRKTLVLDAMGGIERVCHTHICNAEFGGNWGERGFGAFQKGYDLSVNEWLKLLARLDALNESGVAILILSHAKVATFKNPMGADFDRYVADCHPKTWSVTHKWADAVFFLNFFTVVEGGKTGEQARKGKGIGKTQRILYTERRDAFDAKNRYGMQPDIDMPDVPSEMWNTITSAMKGN